MVELCFLALTSTPSMGPSSAEVTCPVNAGADCASAPVDNSAWMRRPNIPAPVKRKRCFNRMVSLPRLCSCLNCPATPRARRRRVSKVACRSQWHVALPGATLPTRANGPTRTAWAKAQDDRANRLALGDALLPTLPCAGLRSLSRFGLEPNQVVNDLRGQRSVSSYAHDFPGRSNVILCRVC